MTAEEVVAAYAQQLFIRSEAEARRPVVLLSGERTNVYSVLERHFRETALPPSERFWRTVRTQWSPQLETWRPRVNGVQLKVLAGARLPDSDEEWAALRAALTGLRQHLRPESSPDRLHSELREFVGMVVSWWENRKKTEGAAGAQLLKRVASAGLLLGGSLALPLAKKQCLELLPLQGPPHHPPPPTTTGLFTPVYAAPEIVPHALLGGSGPPRMLPPSQATVEELQAAGGSQHGGGSYMQHLVGAAVPTDSQLFDQLFPGGMPAQNGHANGGGVHDASPGGSPREGPGQHAQSPQVQQQQQQQEGSGDDRHKEPARAAQQQPNPALTKRFVTLNVGGHRFSTTAATLASVEGSYFYKLAQQAGGSSRGAAPSEFFVDRSGKIFEHVLDYLRSRRFGDSPSTLPKDERTLQLLAREAEFYHLPELAERARASLATAAAAATAAPGGGVSDNTPSDVPAHFAEGSAHGGQLMLGRLGAAAGGHGSGGALPGRAAGQQASAGAAAATLDAIFLETGFVAAAELAGAQAGLLESLNAQVAAKQAEGFAVADCQCGTEREGALRSLHYHVLLRKAAA